MTRTFERFLRSFSDEDLEAFAQDRQEKRPPYWRAMRVALRIEFDRRGLRTGDDWNAPAPGPAGSTARRVSSLRGSGVANGA
jgi:hypothetical protein